MKNKFLTLCGAVLCASSLSSCYVYDDPLSWSSPYPSQSYGRSYYQQPVYRSYGRGFGSGYGGGYGGGYGHGHCAPVPPPCHGSFGHHPGHF